MSKRRRRRQASSALIQCGFDSQGFSRDLREKYGITLTQIPELYAKYFGHPLNRTTAYSWFRDERSMTMRRFVELRCIVHRELGQVIDPRPYMIEFRP